ncbi:hypothetical protein ATE69_20865 [Sphingopyxis sp. H071]|jgi:hypothetical protein|nr:hypothetical protein ATE69_20865 [Sphingopyxis sp. H071]
MIDRGVNHNAALVALANKLARIAWAALPASDRSVIQIIELCNIKLFIIRAFEMNFDTCLATGQGKRLFYFDTYFIYNRKFYTF